MKKIMITIIKGLMITVSIIVLMFGILTILDKTVFKRTPESVLKSTFGISLKNFDYNVEIFDDQMHPLGEGRTLVIYKFYELTQENIDYLKGFDFKSLPISEEEQRLMHFNKIPKEYFEVDTGYFIYETLHPVDFRRNYKVFVVDTEKKIAVLFYQYM